ncbi:MAG: 4-hydroxy-tetrahydrodipicolinate reductase [Firmicutes bacterium]|nr:4-hydroxy-tetrahydrodipicolinate reductase [Bacillota bacterium]
MKTKIFLFGISGKMGKSVLECSFSHKNLEVVGGFDFVQSLTLPTFSHIKNVNINFDAIIDFSRPDTLDSVIALAEKTMKPVVIATTGFSDEQKKKIEVLSKKVPVFLSSNMSVGVNVLLKLVSEASKYLCSISDIEIIEKHHNQKVDAPSGTARMILDSIESSCSPPPCYGRVGHDALRQDNEIGVHAIRGGTIVGEHAVLFCMNDEVVSIKHEALSRKIFANGALKAADFLTEKKAGLYNMNDLIEVKNKQ